MDYPSLRAKRPYLTGTAVCRPARAVVWHSWLAEKPSVSHGEPILLSSIHFKITISPIAASTVRLAAMPAQDM
jgi:hypothetical protein